MTENISQKKFPKNLEEYYKSKLNQSPKENTPNNNKDILLIYVLTFNMKGRTPTELDIPLLFPPDINKFDLFIISTQECLRSIAASMIMSSKEEWIQLLSEFFGENYYNLINSNLGPCHLCVFAKKEMSINFQELRNGEIETGLFNFFSNKGAVSVSMKYKDKNIAFIGCHLAAGQDNNEKRNEDLKRIKTSLKISINFDAKNKQLIQKKKLSESLNIFPSKEITFRKNELNRDLINNNDNNQEPKDKLKSLKTFAFNKKENQVLNLNNNKEKKDEIDENKNNKKSNDDFDFQDIKEIESEKDEKEQNDENKNLIENNTDKNNKIKIPELFKDKQNITIDNKITKNIPEDKNKEKTMDDFDIVILCGDLNYRLNFEKEENIDEIMKQKNPELLWNKDQFKPEIKNEHGFQEGIINFMPTYKYKDNSDEYDYERIPGWTDRILYKSKKNYDIMLCQYNSIQNVYLSDHKPVYAVFKINFKNKELEDNCNIKNNINDDCIIF